MNSLVLRKVKHRGVVKLERVQVICPACGQQVEAVAGDGRVKGYCAVARQHVDFVIETQLAPQSVVRISINPTAETRVKLSASLKKRWQDPEYRAKQRVHIVTAETRAKMSAAHTGKHPTAETRAKISVAYQLKKVGRETEKGGMM